MGSIRVVVAKVGLDGHDRGAKVVARTLRDAGVEVIYTGLHQTPEQVVEAALQEDADGIGLSILSGAHMTLCARVLELLHERDAGDITVFAGGIIPDADIPELERMGVARVFTPGASTQEIVSWIYETLAEPGSTPPARARSGAGSVAVSGAGPAGPGAGPGGGPAAASGPGAAAASGPGAAAASGPGPAAASGPGPAAASGGNARE